MVSTHFRYAKEGDASDPSSGKDASGGAKAGRSMLQAASRSAATDAEVMKKIKKPRLKL